MKVFKDLRVCPHCRKPDLKPTGRPYPEYKYVDPANAQDYIRPCDIEEYEELQCSACGRTVGRKPDMSRTNDPEWNKYDPAIAAAMRDVERVSSADQNKNGSQKPL